MAPSYAEWKIIFEFRSAGRQLIQQHSALAGSITTPGSKMGRNTSWDIHLFEVTSLFNVNTYPY